MKDQYDVVIVGGAVIVAAASFAVWYFGFFRKKQK